MNKSSIIFQITCPSTPTSIKLSTSLTLPHEIKEAKVSVGQRQVKLCGHVRLSQNFSPEMTTTAVNWRESKTVKINFMIQFISGVLFMNVHVCLLLRSWEMRPRLGFDGVSRVEMISEVSHTSQPGRKKEEGSRKTDLSTIHALMQLVCGIIEEKCGHCGGHSGAT